MIAKKQTIIKLLLIYTVYEEKQNRIKQVKFEKNYVKYTYNNIIHPL